MKTSNDLWRLVAQIRNADMSATDREVLRPTFAALDDGKTIAVPGFVQARIRDIAARTPK